jgi:multimeric flavodoxin WrbA
MSAAVLVVNGSYRTGGNTDAMLDAVIEGIGNGVHVEYACLRDMQISSCVGCEACQGTTRCARFKDDMTRLYDVIDAAKGIVLGSPTYNYNVTACMKAFIDRLYPYYEFGTTMPRPFKGLWEGSGKHALVCTVCEQASPRDMGFVVEAMQWPLQALGCDSVATVSAMLAFKKGDILKDAHVLGKAKEAGRELGSRIKDDKSD